MDALQQNEVEEIETLNESFTVTNLESANWCFRKIAALNAKIEENKQLADKERERINLWEQKENESAKQSIEYFETLLKDYYSRLKANDVKVKVSTPYGKISTRKQTKWNYTDEKALLKFLKENNEEKLIRVTEEINKVELKTKYKNGVDMETGEVLPGVEVSTEENIVIKVE